MFQNWKRQKRHKPFSVVAVLYCFAIYFDLLTTYTALKAGAIESNKGIIPYINPAFLQAQAPYIWYILMICLMIFGIWIMQTLSKYYKINIGAVVLVIPIIIELRAVFINIGNMI